MAPAARRALVLACCLSLLGCLVKRKECFRDEDCTEPKICQDGRCVWECRFDTDCEEGFECDYHVCVPAGVDPITCPENMAAVANTFCMDIWEASRPDATETSQGEDDSAPVSRPGVLPWTGNDEMGIEVHGEDAAGFCEAAGKRLCTSREWETACAGSAGSIFVYGDDYDPQACVGRDWFDASVEPHLLPTGTFPDCVNEWGIFDLCGNAYEHVYDPELGYSDSYVRGGSYTSLFPESETHRCDYVPMIWVPCLCSLGFRCCITPGESPEEPVEVVESEITDFTVEDVVEVVDATDLVEEDLPEDDAPSPCLPEMVLAGTFCIDRWEASREDATATWGGFSDVPTSRPGVMPWNYATLDGARTACESVSKHLCTEPEWIAGCEGSVVTTFTYGNDYDPETCNGADAFCDCSSTACSGLTTCPYAGCYGSESPEGGGPCGGSPQVTGTGSFPGCTNDYRVLDASGNMWEIVDLGDTTLRLYGGGFNSIDAEAQHACLFWPSGWAPTTRSRGFRCCREPEF